jgi:uncharacterized membrane protein YkoI
MRKKAAITSGIAAAVLGGGLALALNGGGSASAAEAAANTAAQARPAAASPSVASTTISRSQAEQIALKAVPGGQVRSAELENEHGVPVWSVKVIKSGVIHDLNIDARTGEIVRNRADRPHRAAPRHTPAGEAVHRHGEPEPGDDRGRGRETEARHGGDDGHRGRG